MAAAKKPKFTRWHNGDTPLEEQLPSEQVAHAIASEFGDLTPSVERIMSAEISDDERHQAILLFQESLSGIDDPNRDPRVAIATAQAGG